MTRLIIEIIQTTLEEVFIALVGFWFLPKIGIRIPLVGVLLIMLAWLAWSVVAYRSCTGALRKKPTEGMIGRKGKVVNKLAPEGLVKIGGELWTAESENGEIQPGVEVIVVKQDRLKLLVRTI